MTARLADRLKLSDTAMVQMPAATGVTVNVGDVPLTVAIPAQPAPVVKTPI